MSIVNVLRSIYYTVKKKKKTEEDEPMVDEKEEDLDLSGFTIS